MNDPGMKIYESGALQPQGWNTSPMWINTIATMTAATYEYNRYGLLSNAALRMMARTFIPATIIRRITNWAAEYSDVSSMPYQQGWRIRYNGPGSPSMRDRKDIIRATEIVERAGWRWFDGGFDAYIKAVVPHALTYAKWTHEIVKKGDKPWAFIPLDPVTIFKKMPDQAMGIDDGKWFADLEPYSYVQVVDQKEVNEFGYDEIGYGVRHPSGDINMHGQGVPELELSIPQVTEILNIFVANSSSNVGGIRPRNVFVFHTDSGAERFDTMRSDFENTMSNVRNKRKDVVLQANPTLKEKMELIRVPGASTEMEAAQQFATMVKLFCANYNMNPAALNLNYGNEFQTSTITGSSGSESNLESSKVHATKPVLLDLAKVMNRSVVQRAFPKLKFEFTGLDPRSTAQRIEDAAKQSATYLSTDEIRTIEGFEPFGDPISSRPRDGAWSAWAANQSEGEVDEIDDTTISEWINGR